ncbi:DUF2339 domain-containing protein [Pelotomaculum propionicicum]|uniref:DUF2339 domain-containing protein n=1 Tax=Pelotomaculum propionicicum TaxID=258475 RepID=UPI003B778802
MTPIIFILLLLLALLIWLPIYALNLGSSVKELKNKIESLSSRINELEARLAATATKDTAPAVNAELISKPAAALTDFKTTPVTDGTVPSSQEAGPAEKAEMISKPAAETGIKIHPVKTGTITDSQTTAPAEKTELIAKPALETNIQNPPDTAVVEPLTAVTQVAEESPEIQVSSPYDGIQKPVKSREPQKNWLDTLIFTTRTKEEWEELVGGKLLNRIGALALIIGIGFFLKYSFDNNWISETARVLIGFLAGVAILYSGARFHKKGYQIFAQGIFGAGVSVLYLSAYASFNYYHLVSQTAAFALMSAVTLTAFFMAFRYDSLAISLLGWAGGSLTPFLLSTGQANEIGLFIYLSLLQAGFLIVLTKKTSWTILEPLTFITTYLIYFLWFNKYYSPADIIATIVFLTIFWGLFHLFYIFNILRTKVVQMSQAIAVLNAFIYYAAMYLVINHDHHQWMGLATLAICFAYFIPLILFKQRLAGDAKIYAQYVLSSILFLVIATANHFDGFKIPIFWSIEAAFLAWYGNRYKINYVWLSAVGLLALSSIWLALTKGAFYYLPVDQFNLILNLRSLAFIILAASLGLTSSFCKNIEYKFKDMIAASLHYGWCVTLLILFTIEINDYFRSMLLNVNSLDAQSLIFKEYLTLSMVWMVYSLILTVTGIKRRVLSVLHCGVGVLALSAAAAIYSGLSYKPIDYFTLVFNYRFAAFLVIIAGLYINSRVFAGEGEKFTWMGKAALAAQVVLALTIFELVTVETIDYFSKLTEGMKVYSPDYKFLEFYKWLTLAVVWIAYSLPVSLLSLRKKLLPVFYCGAGAFVLSVLTATIRGIAFAPIDYFSLLLNYRAAAMLFVIGGTLVIARALKNYSHSYKWLELPAAAVQVVLALTIFELVTVETIDHFSKLIKEAGVALTIYRTYELYSRMTLAMVWMAYCLPVSLWALKKKNLPVLYCGAGAFVLSVISAAIRGTIFTPIDDFSVLCNYRAAAMMFVIFGTLFIARVLKKYSHLYNWLEKSLTAAQVCAIVLGFLLISGETYDYFRKEIYLLSMSGTDFRDGYSNLKNMQQMAMSLAWLIYSIFLMVLGFSRRIRNIRIISIILFGLTIIKIFSYDLSFLETLYRIFSFITLGLILLAASFLYSRYKSVILDFDNKKGPSEPPTA